MTSRRRGLNGRGRSDSFHDEEPLVEDVNGEQTEL